jgi:hypothetical protein
MSTAALLLVLKGCYFVSGCASIGQLILAFWG